MNESWVRNAESKMNRTLKKDIISNLKNGVFPPCIPQWVKPIVYIAGPYTQGDPVQNVNSTIKAADGLLEFATPYIPHLNMVWHLVIPHSDPDFWYTYDNCFIPFMHTLLRLEGSSHGADNEEILARKYGIPVFKSVDELRKWAAEFIIFSIQESDNKRGIYYSAIGEYQVIAEHDGTKPIFTDRVFRFAEPDDFMRVGFPESRNLGERKHTCVRGELDIIRDEMCIIDKRLSRLEKCTGQRGRTLEKCPVCDGDAVVDGQKCGACKGTGDKAEDPPEAHYEKT